MSALRQKHGLIDTPPVYADQPDASPFLNTEKKEKPLYAGLSAPRRHIVFDSCQSEEVALRCAHGEGQKVLIRNGIMDVERDKSKLRQRIEDAGLHASGTRIPRQTCGLSDQQESTCMTGPEMQAIRKRLGLSTIELGRAMGYVGADNTVSVTIRRYESGGREIPPWLARLLVMFDRHGVPEDFK